MEGLRQGDHRELCQDLALGFRHRTGRSSQDGPGSFHQRKERSASSTGSLAALVGHFGANYPKGRPLYKDTFTWFRVFALSIVHSSSKFQGEVAGGPCHLAELVG